MSERRLSVLESREGRPLRLRPWVLLLGAAIVVVVVAAAAHDRLVDAEAFRLCAGGFELGQLQVGCGRFRRLDGLVLLRPGVDQPGRRRTERGAERHHFADVLGPGVAARRRADAHPGHRRQMGADERHHADLRPRLAPHPLLPDGGDHPRRHARAALDARRHARRPRTPSTSASRPATPSGSSSCWPSSTTCRSASLPADLRRPGPTWPRTSPAPSRGAGPACRPNSPPSGPRAP